MAASLHPRPLDPSVARIVDQLDEDRREAFEERAAIMEFDGGMARADAEPAALIDTLARYGLPPGSRVRLLQAQVGEATEWVLTTDPASARTRLAELGADDIAEADLDEVVTSQYGDLAFLSTGP